MCLKGQVVRLPHRHTHTHTWIPNTGSNEALQATNVGLHLRALEEVAIPRSKLGLNCILFKNIHIYIHMITYVFTYYNIYIYIRDCVYAKYCIKRWTYIYIYIYYVYIYICIYIYEYIYVYTYTCVLCICFCTCFYMYMGVYIYIYTCI